MGDLFSGMGRERKEPERDLKHYWYAGLDFGKSIDHSAIVIIEQFEDEQRVAQYHLRHCQRLARKVDYFDQCQTIVALLERAGIGDQVTVVYDRSGVGMAIAEMLQKVIRRERLRGIVITGGIEAGRTDTGDYSVPKRDLVANMQLLLGAERVKLARGHDAAGLLDELRLFEVKVNQETGYESFSSPSGSHDDLALAAMLGLWYAERYGGLRRNFGIFL